MIQLQNPTLLFQRFPLVRIWATEQKQQKDILVICSSPSPLPEEERVQLQKILNACKVDMERADVIVTTDTFIPLQQLAATYTARKVLVFGELQLGRFLVMPTSTTVQVGEWILLQTISLKKMLKAGSQEKQKLWEQLQILFGISG
ncbi:MAG: hypothetical protein NZM35_03925 [Chitinophagales bacterium]|nr:hypothetical protein [Chitinophagales bacterium]MDW8418744.1 hypothetical protein [Chitinophagales bacterium]